MTSKQSAQTSLPTGIETGRPTGRTRIEMGFDKAQLLPTLFGNFDENLVDIESRFGVYITARGKRVNIEGSPDDVETTRELLLDLYRLADTGRDIDLALIGERAAATSRPERRDVCDPRGGGAIPMIAIRTRKKTIVPKTLAQANYMRAMASSDVTFGIGPAGTGKTYLAVAQAVSMLIAGTVQRLVLSRPAVEAGEKLGFLPGDMKEKVDPYLRPIYDALNDCLPAEQVERRIAAGEIEIAPIAFMRGRTLADAFIILDEAQNTTPAQMKMFLTRFGENSRMVICGDPKQVDIPGGPAASGLVDAIGRLDGLEGISISRFGGGDVVRHPVVGRIVSAYED